MEQWRCTRGRRLLLLERENGSASEVEEVRLVAEAGRGDGVNSRRLGIYANYLNSRERKFHSPCLGCCCVGTGGRERGEFRAASGARGARGEWGGSTRGHGSCLWSARADCLPTRGSSGAPGTRAGGRRRGQATGRRQRGGPR